ncbi:hypothetical protein QBC39DRAFT_87659 [Podospora conica]|nr:hypothetical protein QBC39DRAFT_87659 [Schizothecium conicum]
MASNDHDTGPGHCPGEAEDPPTRHYPLDIPHLRFFRYEHHLDTRDIMAHRIMADLMNPTRVPVATYATPVKHPAEFNAISTQDKMLGADLRCLQKMLFTTYVNKPSEKVNGLVLGANPPPTLEDQAVDLVSRYYFERDSAPLRAWMAHIAPGRSTTGSRSTTGLRNYGFFMVNGGNGWCIFTLLENDHRNPKRKCDVWTPGDARHLERLRQIMRRESLLYGGGAYIPSIRRISSAFNGPGQDTCMGPKHVRWALRKDPRHVTWVCNRPLEFVKRFIIQPTWKSPRTVHSWAGFLDTTFADITLNYGRCRHRTDIWCSGT